MIIYKIKSAYLQVRKLKDEKAKALYSTLISDIEKVAKDDGNRHVTDDDCLKVINATLKRLQKTLSDPKVIAHLSEEDASGMLADIYILSSFLPELMSEEELDKIIDDIIKGGCNKLGNIMSILKRDYNGKFDNKIAVDIIKEKL